MRASPVRVTNITDYGAFRRTGAGHRGPDPRLGNVVTKKNMHPGKIVSTSQEVEVQVLEVDSVKRRISLGLKADHAQSLGSVRREIPGRRHGRRRSQNKTEFGLFLVSKATSTAWCICPTSTGSFRASR